MGKEQVKEVVKSCEIDVCAYLNNPLSNEVYCKAIESFIQLCEEAGIVVNWRKFVNCRKFDLQYYFSLIMKFVTNECENAFLKCLLIQD